MGKVNARVQHAFIRLKPERDKRHADDIRKGGNHTGGADEPPGGNDVETRVAILESHVEHIRRDLDSVATDVRALRKEMRDEFTLVGEASNDFRAEVRDEFKDVRTEMREGFQNVRTEMREGFQNVRTEMRDEFKDVRKEMREEFKDVRKEVREDFRILFSALVALALGMAGMMAKGFGWL